MKAKQMTTRMFLMMFGAATMFGMSAVGCGESEEDAKANDGRTECGSNFSKEVVYCEANHYCADQVFSDCVLGCASNNNCASGQVCVKESGQDIGSCQSGQTAPDTNNTNSNNATPTGDQARCEAAMDKGKSCNTLNAQEVAAGKAGCADTSADGKLFAKAIADCVDAAKVCGAELDSCFGKDQSQNNNTGSMCSAQGQGYTQCGDPNQLGECCQPGQYCEDAAFGECEIGCTSNANCAADQVCDLSEGAPGFCQ